MAMHHTGGIIDKYIGDSVMALWNVPTPATRSRRRCLPRGAGLRRATSARSMNRREWKEHRMRAIPTRFGINTAEVIGRSFRRSRSDELYRYRRRSEPGIPPGRAQQAVRHIDHRQREHLQGGWRPLLISSAGRGRRERQNTRRAHLRTARRALEARSARRCYRRL